MDIHIGKPEDMYTGITFLAGQVQEHIEIWDREFYTCFLYLVEAVLFALKTIPACPEAEVFLAVAYALSSK